MDWVHTLLGRTVRPKAWRSEWWLPVKKYLLGDIRAAVSLLGGLLSEMIQLCQRLRWAELPSQATRNQHLRYFIQVHTKYRISLSEDHVVCAYGQVCCSNNQAQSTRAVSVSFVSRPNVRGRLGTYLRLTTLP